MCELLSWTWTCVPATSAPTKTLKRKMKYCTRSQSRIMFVGCSRTRRVRMPHTTLSHSLRNVTNGSCFAVIRIQRWNDYYFQVSLTQTPLSRNNYHLLIRFDYAYTMKVLSTSPVRLMCDRHITYHSHFAPKQCLLVHNAAQNKIDFLFDVFLFIE